MITHISGASMAFPFDDGTPTKRLILIADKHDVNHLISTLWPGVGRCDSCGRIIVRGMGRWWERGEWR